METISIPQEEQQQSLKKGLEKHQSASVALGVSTVASSRLKWLIIDVGVWAATEVDMAAVDRAVNRLDMP